MKYSKIEKHGRTLSHHPDGLTRCYSRGRGKGYKNEPAYCTRCLRSRTKVVLRLAYWMVKCRYHQRYYCDECVKVTKAWKERGDGRR